MIIIIFYIILFLFIKLQQEVVTLEELNSIRISRDELEKWVYTSLFNKTVIGNNDKKKKKQKNQYKILNK